MSMHEQEKSEDKGQENARRTPAKGSDGQLTPVTARGEATRRRILDAAEGVFGEMGYYEASISEITRRAGVAQGTFYIYFHSKREIFAEMVEDLGQQLRKATSQAVSGTSNRIEAERRGFAAFFEFASTHHRIYSIVQEAERVAPEAAAAYYNGISRGYIRGLHSAMKAGEIRSINPEALAYALMGIGHFVALRWIIWPQVAEDSPENKNSNKSEIPPQLPEEIFASLLDFITHGLTPPSAESHSDEQPS